MGFLDRLLGRDHPARPQHPSVRTTGADARALERYQYLLRTAPPETLEQIHREAFSRLTPEQRSLALRELNAAVPPSERLDRAEPAALARMATRTELMRPGTLVTALGPPSVGLGGLLAGGLLSSLVGSALGTMLANELLEGFHSDHFAAGDTAADSSWGGADMVGAPLDTAGPGVNHADWSGSNEAAWGDAGGDWRGGADDDWSGGGGDWSGEVMEDI